MNVSKTITVEHDVVLDLKEVETAIKEYVFKHYSVLANEDMAVSFTYDTHNGDYEGDGMLIGATLRSMEKDEKEL